MRAFEVNIVGCHVKNIRCPHSDSTYDRTSLCGLVDEDWLAKRNIYVENRDGITPSCPMFAQSMEVEG